MKYFFILASIILAIQFLRVECDQTLGNIIAYKDLSTIAHRNSLVGGLNAGGGFKSAQIMYKIWIRGTSSGEFNAVSNSISSAGCTMAGSNFNDQYRGIPMWGYVVARVRCYQQSQWTNLVYDWNFYARVAFTERQFLTYAPTDAIGQTFLSKRETLVVGDFNEPTGYNLPKEERSPTWSSKPSEEELQHVRSYMQEEARLKQYVQRDLNKINANTTAEEIEKMTQKRIDCFVPDEMKRRVDCDPPGQPTDPWGNPPPPPPYYPPPPPPSPYTPPGYDCFYDAVARNMIEKLTGNETVEERDVHQKRLERLCPGTPTPYIPPPVYQWPPAMILGFEQEEGTISFPKNSQWQAVEGRPWLNYLETLKWSHQTETNYANVAAKFFVLDTGVNENHAEFNGKNSQLLRLPNMVRSNGNIYEIYAGFIDPTILDYFGESPYHEDYTSHGTAITSLIIGNTLGLARTATVYYGKIIANQYVDVQGVEEAYRSVAMMIEGGHVNRPAVVTSSLSYIFREKECYKDRIDNNEPMCAQGIVDAIRHLHNIGVATVIPSGNGANLYDILYDEDGYSFPNTGISYYACNDEPLSAISVDVCITSQWTNDPWNLLYPVHAMKYENYQEKPFIVSATDSDGIMRRWRNIQYGYGEDNNDPWWSIGSPNNGECIDFTAPSTYMTSTAANTYAKEHGHYFNSGYKTAPYLESGTSFAAPMASVIIMHAMARYQPPHIWETYNSNYVEWIRTKVLQNTYTVSSDYDNCRSNNWNDAEYLESVPRLKIFY